MSLSEILKPEAVKVFSSMSSKKRLLQDVGDIAESAYGLRGGLASDALMERESLGPTGVGNGIALPHARMHGLDTILGIFVRLDKPIDFDSVDRQPVDLIFTLFAPEDSGVAHLKALALVSRTMRDSSICQKLRANSDPVTLHALLTDATATKAA